MAYRQNNELELFEVSRGARKLNQMIDSWSKSSNLDNQFKNIAGDLMRGSLDLHESLTMLRKLQEASKMVSEMKLKRELEEEEENAAQIMASRRFQNFSHDKLLQPPTLAIAELKKVVRESIYRQALPSVSAEDEKASSTRSLGFSTRRNSSARESSKQAKAPNLIAKLMGLDEFPLQTVRPTTKEQKNEKCSANRPRMTLDIEMPKSSKLQLIEHTPELKNVESVKSKQVLKSNRIDKPCFSDASNLKVSGRKSHINEAPPIVIMKSLHLPYSERRGEVHRDLHFYKVVIDEAKVEDNEPKFSANFLRKELKIIDKIKVESYVSHKLQREEVRTTRKRGNGDRKSMPRQNRRETEEEDVKDIESPAKPDRRLATSKSSVQTLANRANGLRKHNLTSTSKPTSVNSTAAMKVKKLIGAKPVRKSTDIKAVNGNTKCKEDGKETNTLDDSNGISTAKQPVQDSIPRNREHKRKDQNLFCEVMVKTTKGNRGSESTEEARNFPDNKTTIRRAAEFEEDDIKPLLLSCQSFLSNAQQLFGLDSYQTSSCQRREVGARSTKLLLGCARELMVQKSHQLEYSNHPMLQTSSRSWNVVVSLDKLVEEISNRIQKLCDDAVTSKESVYVRLERDLSCKDVMLNAMWDMWWLNGGICVEEADHVVDQVEEHILCWLVDEVVEDLAY